MMFNSLRLAAIGIAAVLGTGCASLTTPNENQVRVETVDEAGVQIADANCVMLRGAVKSEFKTPAVVPITKGSASITVDCTKPGVADGKGVLTSRVGAATFGNILAGGLIGIAVDQATGKAYNFPEWVQVVMGKILSFDRSAHVEGKPTPGVAIAGQTPDTAKPTAQPAVPAVSLEKQSASDSGRNISPVATAQSAK